MPSLPQGGPTLSASARRVAAVGAVVVHRTGRVLLIRRARPPDVGRWTLPGGRVESGESLEAAIVREIHEETGLATRVVCLLGVVPIEREGRAYTIHEHLLVPRDEGEDPPRLVAGDDAAEARWAQRAEVDVWGIRPEVVAVIDRGLEEASLRTLAPPFVR